jgi:uncharacterized membrane protein HdeD (DUF308 family)
MVILMARNWWSLALRGIAAILFGIAAFGWPGLTLVALAYLFGFYALTDGAFALAAVLVGRPPSGMWWPLLVEGLVGILAGVLSLAWPGLTALVLLYMIAAWAIATGVFEIVAAIRLRKEIQGEWLLVLAGLLSIGFGVVLAVRPGAGAVALVWIIGAYAVVFGCLMLVLSLRLRAWGRQLQAVAP